MDRALHQRPPGTVLCRDCYNFTGKRSGPERRRAGARLCAAGIDVHDIDLFGCESYVPLALVSRSPARRGPGSPPSSAA